MAAQVRAGGLLVVHALVYLLMAGLLLLRAKPVNWDTPTNLGYQEGWDSLAVVVIVVALIFGSAQGALWVRGARIGCLVACLFGAAIAFAGAGFHLDGPIANGDEVWTAGREQVVMSQLVWASYWLAETAVATTWMTAVGRWRRVHRHGNGRLFGPLPGGAQP